MEQTQSAAAKQGIWAMYTIIPSLGCIFCIIPLLFYRLRGDDLKEMRRQLAVKRAKRDAAQLAVKRAKRAAEAGRQKNETEAE